MKFIFKTYSHKITAIFLFYFFKFSPFLFIKCTFNLQLHPLYYSHAWLRLKKKLKRRLSLLHENRYRSVCVCTCCQVAWWQYDKLSCPYKTDGHYWSLLDSLAEVERLKCCWDRSNHTSAPRNPHFTLWQSSHVVTLPSLNRHCIAAGTPCHNMTEW